MATSLLSDLRATIEQALVPTEHRDLITWAEAEFRIPEGDGHLHIAPYQAACLREALREDGGQFAYSTVVWSDIKKSIKSTLAAAVCLWWAVSHPWASVKVVANDLKQADSRVAFYIRRAIELNPVYFQKLGVKQKTYLIEFANHARIEAIPIDPKGEAGGNDDIIVFSELWAWNSAAAKAMWTEMTLSPMKFGRSLRWCETYAGHTGESPILEGLHAQGVKAGRGLGCFDEAYGNDAARLFCLWNTEPRLPWQTPEYYAQEAATLVPSEFQRVHRNQWVSSESAAFPIEWWDACEDRMQLQPGGKTQVVIGVDASVSGDCTAISMVARHPGTPADAVEVYTRIWSPAQGGKMDYTATITPEVDRLVAEYNVVQVAYDEYQLHHWANEQRAKGKTWYRPFPQGNDRLVADKQLYDLVKDKRLHHSGNPELRQHVQNCAAKVPPQEDNRLRFIKKHEMAKIDGVVSLSMATAELLRLNTV